MRVLVTGAAGYVGTAVVRELLARAHLVVAVVRESTAVLPAAVEVRTGDLRDEAFTRDAVRDVDAVCHLAALTRVRSAAADPARYHRTNVGCTVDLLDAMAATGRPAGRIVFASTGSVYGTPERQPIAEDTPPSPLNPYAASKAACEEVIGRQVATGGIGAVSLRLFNVAGGIGDIGDIGDIGGSGGSGGGIGGSDRIGGGADPDPTRIIPKTVAVAAGRAECLQVNGDGTAVRDFVHVADVASAFALALEAAGPGRHTVYNVGATPASVHEIIAAVERVSGRTVAVEYRPAYAGEAPVLKADTARIRAELGWRPERSALDTLVRAQWEAERRGPKRGG